MTDVGELALWIALLLATWSAVVSLAGARSQRADLIVSGRRAIYGVLAFTFIAAAALLNAILTPDFSVAYVSNHVSASTPLAFAVAAFWSGREGGLLFASLVLAAVAVPAIRAEPEPHARATPWVIGTLATILAFLLATAAFHANPFARIEWLPVDGRGLHPQLRHLGMALHLAALSAGYVMTAVAFAFAIGALATASSDHRWWLATARSWALGSWSVVSAGIALGMWSTYAEQGADTLWRWDAAELVSLGPWITGAALFFCVPWAESGGARRLNVTLVLAMFLTSLPGVFITLASRVSEPMSPALATWVVAFLTAAIATTLWLAVARMARVARPSAAPVGDVPRKASDASGARTARRLVQAGAVLLAVVFAGSALRATHVATLTAGEELRATDPFGRQWRFVSQGLSTDRLPSREVSTIALAVWRDDQSAGLIMAEERQYLDSQRRPTFGPSRQVGIRIGLLQDVSVALTALRAESADIQVRFTPLVAWAWLGWGLIVAGGLLAAWPAAASERRE